MKKKHMEQMQVSRVKFLREQDGLPERALKQRLVEYFRQSGGVQAAYLACVAYGSHAQRRIAIQLRRRAASTMRD
jgi:hypothetical protein